MAKKEETNPYTELARNLCAGYLAFKGGISITTAMKNYCQGPVEPWWLALAEQIDRSRMNAAVACAEKAIEERGEKSSKG